LGDNFGSDCKNLKKIDLSKIKRLGNLGENFMKSCHSLEHIILPIYFKNKISKENFIDCPKLNLIVFE
jgi:hypothetical protein